MAARQSRLKNRKIWKVAFCKVHVGCVRLSESGLHRVKLGCPSCVEGSNRVSAFHSNWMEPHFHERRSKSIRKEFGLIHDAVHFI
jgi:hypothetical protein